MTDPNVEHYVEHYVERAAALGIDPTKAREEAEGIKALFAAFPRPRPVEVPPSAYGTLFPTPRRR
ncbi:MAG: hypothetical protein ROZ37_04240 [Aromatoleum sp.]|jgi:hypothetical protein|uniref:hypothetical protein n=1 Tax=Aromatoleum sp. TaxID=2307007 RepID=UPI002894917B|nr:hypothetical protein [Aromatoleum sp.]MDT3669529.1 hypothetical protein [Aromatoleum sp.]